MWGNLIPKIGIDLGTTNVLVFVPGQGVLLNEPSVVAVSEEGQVLAVGAEAKQMIGRTPETIRAYRPMKDGVIADYRVTETMLRYLLRKALHRFNLLRPDVMVSVPAVPVIVTLEPATKLRVFSAEVKTGSVPDGALMVKSLMNRPSACARVSKSVPALLSK